MSRKLSSCLGEKERELFENYQTALYQHLEREDKEFFLRTLALGIELGQLNRPMAFSGPSFI